MPASPFKFLDSFTLEDREIFFGRDREIEELYHRVFESKIMLVYGVSGTGKSSLIHCGLANKFQDTDWLPVNVRRGGDMVKSMVRAIGSAAITPLNSIIENPAQFKKAIQSLYLDHYKPIYFIFDQFEELFIFGNREERKIFAQIIKTLAASDLQCRFLFILREEYLAGVTEFEKSIPSFLANRVRIEKMSLLNAREAIQGPCGKFNIILEEGFSLELLEKLYPNDAEVELTYLQVFLDKLFRLAVKDHPGEAIRFSKNLLQQTGNVSDLLGSFLDEQISLLSDPDTSLAVLKSFVSVKGTKRQMSPEEIRDYSQTLGKPIETLALQELIQTFINLRILRDKDQNNRYELRHDALAEKIYEKITMVEKELLEIRQLIENAYHNWEKRGVLISADDLSYIAPFESRLYLSREFESLVEQSKYALVRAKKRIRNLAITAGLLTILILAGFTIWALNERSKAVNALQEKEKLEKKLNETAYDYVFAATKMNVFYKGVNNPFSYAIPGMGEHTKVYFDLPGIMHFDTITGNQWIRIDTVGNLNVTVHSMINGSMENLGKRFFRVKYLPDPIVTLAGEINGTISKGKLLKANGLITEQIDVDFECSFNILSYKITYQVDGALSTAKVYNNNITEKLKSIFIKIDTNSAITFSEIKVFGSDKVARTLKNLTLIVN